MSVAADTVVLKRRIDDYLWHDKSMPLVHLRALLHGPFETFRRLAIIGGLVRDFARKGVTGFRSDIDLVIDAPREEVVNLALQLKARPNRFGGYSYSHPNWKLDFWALETTWAATNGHVQVKNFSDLKQCTFFDWDAVLYDVWSRKIISGDDYLEMLKGNEIEINLLVTPSIQGNLLRSIRRLLLWNVQAGPILKNFILTHLNSETFRAMASAEQSIFPNPILGPYDGVSDLTEVLFSMDARPKISTSFGKQLTLPGM